MAGGRDIALSTAGVHGYSKSKRDKMKLKVGTALMENDTQATEVCKNIILNLSKHGMNKSLICSLAGITPAILSKIEKENPDFASQLRVAFSERASSALGKLWENIEANDERAIEFYLNRIAGVDKATPHESEVRITVSLPQPPRSLATGVEAEGELIDITPLKGLDDGG